MLLPLERLRSFGTDRSGAAAMLFGLSIPVLFGGVSIAVEYSSIASRHSKLQRAVDTAALAATRELSLANVDDNRVSSVAASVVQSALAQTGGAKSASGPSVAARVTERRRGVKVDASEDVETVFGRLLTYPTYKVSVTASAQMYGATKLCVLSLDQTAAPALSLDKNAKVSAPECSVYSNSASPQGLLAKDNAYLQAERICTVGGYSAGAGTISTTPLTDCPSYDDPLAGRPIPANANVCNETGLVVTTARLLMPGVYCNGLKIDGSNVTLSAGTYIISGGPLVVSGGGSLTGDGVGFYLAGDQATFDFRPDSTINLSAPKSGEMAGLLFFEDRNAPLLRTHNISSKGARKLLGTFYLSRGLLKVDSNSPVADQSAYTVIVSRKLELTASPNLVMNAMYSSTDVPVPEGVGPNGSAIKLTR
jgi:Flp pilus assembly protein TadG